MKTNIRPNQKIAAFSMIEMIGVLAVIAILAALLIPKVFEAISTAKINNTASSLGAVKTAVVNHYGKYGALNTQAGTNTFTQTSALATNYASVLLQEGMLDKPFESKLTTNAVIQMVAAKAAGAVDGTGGAYWLSGQGANASECASSTLVVEARLYKVAISDAIALSQVIDGNNMSTNDTGAADFWGRVVYATPASGLTDVFVYMANK